MNFQFQKGTGTAFLNAVRAESFLQQKVLRPVAFKVGTSSNVLDTPECVLEDMTTFITDLSNALYSTTCEDEMLLASYTFNGELLLSQLLRDSNITANRDFPILHSNNEVMVSVVFRYTTGTHLSADNAEFLKKYNLTGYVAVNSRHCTIESFTVNKIGESDDAEKFSVIIQTSDKTSEQTILYNALQAMNKSVDEMLKYLS